MSPQSFLELELIEKLFDPVSVMKAGWLIGTPAFLNEVVTVSVLPQLGTCRKAN
jgi:hypothetical protein